MTSIFGQLRGQRNSDMKKYDPVRHEGPTMKRDPVIIICVDASSEPPVMQICAICKPQIQQGEAVLGLSF